MKIIYNTVTDGVVGGKAKGLRDEYGRHDQLQLGEVGHRTSGVRRSSFAAGALSQQGSGEREGNR